MLLSDYPKNVKLLNGKDIVIKPMVPDDKDALFDFFSRIPREDRLYIKEDTSNPSVIQRWANELDYDVILPILAWDEDKIVGDATLHRNKAGWSQHVGEIRLIVDPAVRNQGLGTILAGEIFNLALRTKLDKIVVETMEEQEKVRKIFLDLGFSQEALLKDHVKDIAGRKHNLVIISHDVEELWNKVMELSEQFGRAMEY